MLTLITDRKQSDIDRAKQLIAKAKNIESLSSSELEEYLGGLKGCYNISDLNRVESAVQYISDLLNSYNYTNEVETKEWRDGELFTITEMERYLRNLDILKASYYSYDYTPIVPSSYKSVNEANDIEKILIDLESIIKKMMAIFRYANTFNSGGMEGLI